VENPGGSRTYGPEPARTPRAAGPNVPGLARVRPLPRDARVAAPYFFSRRAESTSRAVATDEAGFCPVTSRPSRTAKLCHIGPDS
jgi:hypothetical protein